MGCITISRGSYSYGKEIAEKVAARLNYECVGRDALLEASETFNIPEIKLLEAIRDAPSVLGRFTYGKERYISYIQAALLNKMKKDNIVYQAVWAWGDNQFGQLGDGTTTERHTPVQVTYKMKLE